jgi:hypothetical protein
MTTTALQAMRSQEAAIAQEAKNVGITPQTQQNQYNAYINQLLNSGQEPKTISQNGTAYRNFGVSPYNSGDYIFGKYLNGKFNVSYQQPKNQAG